MRNRRVLSVVAMAALVSGLSACAGDDEDVAESSSTPAPVSSSSTSVEEDETEDTGEAPAEDGEEAAPGEVTEPGTELAIGKTATIPFEYAKKSGTIAITVTGIEKGEEADLEEYGDKAKGLVPYFVKYTVENVDGSDLAHASVRLRAITEDGRGTGVIITGGVPGKCESNTGGSDFTSAGATFESCTLQAAQEGVEVSGAQFADDDYSDAPIVWTK